MKSIVRNRYSLYTNADVFVYFLKYIDLFLDEAKVPPYKIHIRLTTQLTQNIKSAVISSLKLS